MGWVRDQFQALVFAGNRSAPVSRAQRAVYRRGVGHAARRFGALPAVRDVYLRHGLTREDWVPGLSDIDLSVVIEDGIAPDLGFALLDRLWRAHRRSKRWFPMLGEVDVLTPARLAGWSAIGIRGRESSGWERIFGTDSVAPRYRESPERLAADSFDHAVAVYLSNFPTRFYAAPANRVLARSLLARMVDKIGRYATQHAPGTMAAEDPAGGGGDELDQLVRAVGLLAAATPRFRSGGSEGPDPTPMLAPRPGAWQPTADAAVVACVLESRGMFHVVVEDGIEDAALRRALVPLLAELDRRRQRAVVSSVRIFEYLLRRHLPFWRDDLGTERTLYFGRDLVPGIPPPSPEACARASLDMVGNALVFPGSRSFHRAFSVPEVKTFVHRVAFARRALEHGALSPSYGETLVACREMHPSLFEALDRLEAEPLDEAVRRGWFARASRLADELAPLVPTAPAPLTDPVFPG